MPFFQRSRSLNVKKLQQERDVEGLLSVLADSTDELRASAADVLGKIRDARAADPLFNVLFKERRERDLAVAVAVMKALGQVADARTVEILITIIEKMGTTEQPEGMPFEAAGASGEIEGTRATEAWLAARMLGEIGGERATEALHAIQKNQAYRQDVRKAAANSLWQIKSSQRKSR